MVEAAESFLGSLMHFLYMEEPYCSCLQGKELAEGVFEEKILIVGMCKIKKYIVSDRTLSKNIFLDIR